MLPLSGQRRAHCREDAEHSGPNSGQRGRGAAPGEEDHTRGTAAATAGGHGVTGRPVFSEGRGGVTRGCPLRALLPTALRRGPPGGSRRRGQTCAAPEPHGRRGDAEDLHGGDRSPGAAGWSQLRKELDALEAASKVLIKAKQGRSQPPCPGTVQGALRWVTRGHPAGCRETVSAVTDGPSGGSAPAIPTGPRLRRAEESVLPPWGPGPRDAADGHRAGADAHEVAAAEGGTGALGGWRAHSTRAPCPGRSRWVRLRGIDRVPHVGP